MDDQIDPQIEHTIDVRRLLDESIATDSARTRASIDAIRSRHAEDASVTGLLANLADLSVEVAITTVDGSIRRGRISTVSNGGIALRSAFAAVAIRCSAITAMRVMGGLRLDGDGSAVSAMSWPTFVASIVEPGDELSISIGGDSVQGRMRSISRAIIQLEIPDGSVAYVVLDAATEVSVSVPGSIRHDSTNSSTSHRFNLMTRPNR